jgi:hypothetical protein
MKKIFTSLLIFFLCVTTVLGTQHIVNGGVSFGTGYSSYFASYLFLRPDDLSFGADLTIFNFDEQGTTSRGYYGALYTQNKLWSQSGVSTSWILGATYTKSDFSTFSTDSVITPGVGIVGRYALTPNLSLDGKAVVVIYSDGYAVPYHIGLTYPMERIDFGIGIQGLLSMVNSAGNTSLSNSYGYTLFVKY